MTHDAHQPSKLSAIALRALASVYLLGVALFAMLPSCATTVPLPEDAITASAPDFVDEPQLARDLDEIRASGVLRILTHNNSSSYLVLRGEEYGFEFEFARRFAKDLGVKIEVVLADSQYSMVSMLNQGKGDIVAAPLALTEDLPTAAAYSQPYHELQQVLVVPKDYVHLYNKVEDLHSRMVAVRRWSNHQETLVNLRRKGIPVGMVMLSPDISTEEILDMVADGTYQSAIAGSHVAQAAVTHRPELAIAFPMSDNSAVGWAVRKNSPLLLAALNGFFSQHYDVRPDGQVVRSALYNVLFNKYFVDEKQIRSRQEHPFRLARTGKLSPFDELIQMHAARNDLDWRLIASLVFQESRFDPQQVSWAGAVGLMQVLPTTANLSEARLKIPEVNVEFGTNYLRELYDSYDYLPEKSRLAFALGSYNAGKGHVDDARMLAIILGRDPNEWVGSVDECLLLLRKPEYHRQVRYGYVRGTETVAYVRDVMRRYELFCELTERDVNRRSQLSSPPRTALNDAR